MKYDPNKKNIIFESFPDFTGSPLAIYKEMIRRGYDKKYNLIWAISGNTIAASDMICVKWFYTGSVSNIEKQKYLNDAKLVIDSNRYIQKPMHGYRLHTRHGSNLKKVPGYSRGIGQVDALLTTSKAMQDVDKIVYPPNVSTKSIITGLPCNDALFNKTDLYANGFIKEITGSNEKYDKVIGWFPTYRQHRNCLSMGSGRKFTFGIPVLSTSKELNDLNDFLKKQNTLLLIQKHHAQATNFQKLPNLSNIKYISEEAKTKCKVTITDIMSFIDAMITDYSSIYFEYLLLNKPIGLCIEDLVEYSKKVGFWYNYLEWIKGEYILECNSLKLFIKNLIIGNDAAKEQRELALNKAHAFKDNKSTERVVDYIENNFKIGTNEN